MEAANKRGECEPVHPPPTLHLSIIIPLPLPIQFLHTPIAELAVMGGTQAAKVLAQIEASSLKSKGEIVDEKKEQELFDTGKEILLGTNKYPNKDDRMKHDLELFPFVKQNPRKTLITPIIEKRLSEKIEQERLEKE